VTEAGDHLAVTEFQLARPPEAPPDQADVIRLDRISQAFYTGVAVGMTAEQALRREITPGSASDQERAAYYWLAVGQQLHARLPEAGEDEQSAFVRGAAVRAPAPDKPVFYLRIDEAPDADEPDVEDEDLELRYRRLGRVIWRVGEAVFSGVTSADAVNGQNTVIGEFQVRNPL
jgi:hypothetical protein